MKVFQSLFLFLVAVNPSTFVNAEQAGASYLRSETNNNLPIDIQHEEEILLQQQHKNENNELTAILHLGPEKTGSTAIQIWMNWLQNDLELDHYERAMHAMGWQYGDINLVNCFQDHQPSIISKQCPSQDIMELPHEIATKRGNNFMLSSELLGDSKRDIQMLQDYLTPYWKNIIVVAFYRRYFMWLYSIHNQLNKKIAVPERVSFLDFLNAALGKEESQWEDRYAGGIHRFRDHFDQIKIYNMHNLPNDDAREAFFCDALPHATHACEEFRRMRSEGIDTWNNPSHAFVYDELAYYAHEMGLWQETEGGLDMEKVALMAKSHQQDDLKQDDYDFPNHIRCPESSLLDRLLGKSLQYEQEFFPAYYDEVGKEEIKRTFEEWKSTMLCVVDARAVLQDSEAWQNFFKSL